MEKFIYITDVLLALSYFALVLYYARAFVSSHRLAVGVHLALPVTLAIHFMKLAIQGYSEGHCPVVGIDETFSFVAFMLGLFYVLVERRQEYASTGVVFISIIFLFQLVAIFTGGCVTPLNQNLQPVQFAFHAPLALFSVAVLLASSLYGGIYLAMYRLLKSKKMSVLFNRVPPLETIERMQGISSLVGVILFGVAIGIGFVIAHGAQMGIAIYDPKIFVSVIVFVIYAYGVIGAYFFNFSGRRKSAIALLGFLVALISMTVVRLWLPTFHSF